jgi:hypothetical protein
MYEAWPISIQVLNPNESRIVMKHGEQLNATSKSLRHRTPGSKNQSMRTIEGVEYSII